MKRSILTLLVIVMAVSVSAQRPPDSAYVIPSHLTFTSEPVLYPTYAPVLLSDTVVVGSTNAPAIYAAKVMGGSGSFVSVDPEYGWTDSWMVVTVCVNYLDVGTYRDTVVIWVDGVDTPAMLSVELQIVPENPSDSAWVEPGGLAYEHEPVPDSTAPPVCLTDTVFLGSLNAPAAYTYEILGGAESFVSVSGGNGFTNDSLEVAICLNGLEPGWHDDTVVFSIEGVSEQPRLAVSLRIEEQYDSAWVEPDSLSFVYPRNPQKRQEVYVSIFSSNAPAHYSCYALGEAARMISIPDSSGYTNDSVLIVIDPSGYLPYAYEIPVEFDVEGCDNRPRVNILVDIGEPPFPDSGHHGVHNQPNPFNPTTTIYFSLENASRVELTVFDILGRKVACLQNGWLPAGDHQVEWSGTDDSGHKVGSGVYLYRLEYGGTVETNKMVLIK